MFVSKVTCTSASKVGTVNTKLSYILGVQILGKGKSQNNTVVFVPCSVTLGINNPPREPQNLLCNGISNPIILFDFTPDLSWRFSDPESNSQLAYQLLVSDNESEINNNNGNLWDTNKVNSSVNSVKYAGNNLEYSKTYFWKVRTWDTYNLPGPYSTVATFTMASKPDYGIHFDGINDYVEIPDTPGLDSQNTAVTIEAYVKYDKVYNDWIPRGIVSKDRYDYNGNNWTRFHGLYQDSPDNRIAFGLVIGGIYYKIVSDIGISSNVWTHVAGV